MSQTNQKETNVNLLALRYLLIVLVLVYNVVMIAVSCFCHTGIFDPLQLLWATLLFLGGPVIVVATLAMFWMVIRKRMSFSKLLWPVIGVVSVAIWSVGFWDIGAYFRPRLFSLVADQNERLVIQAIRNMDDPNHVEVPGFRYPYCKMRRTCGRYHRGALILIVPRGPGEKPAIAYDPNGTVTEKGWTHLTGPWYYGQRRKWTVPGW